MADKTIELNDTAEPLIKNLKSRSHVLSPTVHRMAQIRGQYMWLGQTNAEKPRDVVDAIKKLKRV